MILVAGKWFDWWGGSTWGYRSIVDTAPLLALLLTPAIERLLPGRTTRVSFAVLLWSVGVQFVGAYSYSLVGWSDLRRDYERHDYATLWRWDGDLQFAGTRRRFPLADRDSR